MQKVDFSHHLQSVPGKRYRPDDAYRCVRCRDRGWVTIWHPSAIQKAIRDEPFHHTAVALCTCTAADGNPQHYSERLRSQSRGKPIPVFGDQPWHIDANAPDSRAKAAQYVHRPDGFYEEFAPFE